MGHRTDAAEGSEAPDRPMPRSLSEAVRALAAAQKPGGGVPAYMRWVNRWLARRIAAAAFVAGATPDVVTVVSLVFSLGAMGLLLFAPATWGSGLLIALLLAAAFAFDSADGQLARLMNRSGPRGEWLDHVVDALRTPALHVVVAVAVWLQRQDALIAVLALVMAVALSTQFMSQMLSEQLTRRASGVGTQRRGGNRQSWILLPTDPGVWALLFVLWGSPGYFAVGYAALAAFNLLHIASSLRRRFQDLTALQGKG